MNRSKTHGLLPLVALAATVVLSACRTEEVGTPKIRYGISPYQDTAMPVVARDLGLYNEAHLDVELISVAWEDIIPSLASAGRTIDIGIGSINLLVPRVENLNLEGGAEVIFYYPLYVFKGAALIRRADVDLDSVAALRQQSGDMEALRRAADQLRGKKVGLPQGSPYEQMLFAMFEKAGENYRQEIDLRYVQVDHALPALLGGQLEVAGAGVTQRTEALRHGHKVFVEMEDLGFAEIIGIVTTRRFAEAHPAALDQLVTIWFESVDTLFSDVDTHSAGVLRYLAANASTRYSLEEYKAALTYQEFPRSRDEAEAMFFGDRARFSWMRTWDILNGFLRDTGASKQRVPYDYFWPYVVERRDK